MAVHSLQEVDHEANTALVSLDAAAPLGSPHRVCLWAPPAALTMAQWSTLLLEWKVEAYSAIAGRHLLGVQAGLLSELCDRLIDAQALPRTWFKDQASSQRVVIKIDAEQSVSACTGTRGR